MTLQRTGLLVLAALAAALLAAAWWRVPASRGDASRSATPRAPAGASARPAPRGDAAGPSVHAPDVGAAARQPVGVRAAAPACAAASAPLSGLVRVHGRVLRGELPVPDHDLVFCAPGSGLDDGGAAWDSTDDAGVYEVELPAGRFLVLSGDAGPWIASVEVPGGTRELRRDFALPAGILRGRVVDADGAPLAGASVRAFRSGVSAPDALTAGLLARAGAAESGADGRFELGALGPGRYSIRATAGELCAPPVSVVLSGAMARDLELVLRPGPSLALALVAPGGAPATFDVWIAAGSAPSSLAELGAWSARSTARGELALRGLPPGLYVLGAAGETDAGPVALQALLELGPGVNQRSLAAAECGALSLALVEAGGAPVPDAWLDLRAQDGSLVLASREWLEHGARTDAGGQSALHDVLPGAYRIAAGRGARAEASALVEVRAGATTELRLVLGELLR